MYHVTTNLRAAVPTQICAPALLTREYVCRRRSQAGVSSGSGGGLESAKSILAEEGVKGLYTGYSSNIAYAFPTDAIKFLVRQFILKHCTRYQGVNCIGGRGFRAIGRIEVQVLNRDAVAWRGYVNGYQVPEIE